MEGTAQRNRSKIVPQVPQLLPAVHQRIFEACEAVSRPGEEGCDVHVGVASARCVRSAEEGSHASPSTSTHKSGPSVYVGNGHVRLRIRHDIVVETGGYKGAPGGLSLKVDVASRA